MDELTLEQVRLIIQNKFDWNKSAVDEDAWRHQGNCATYLKALEHLCVVLSVEDAYEILERAYYAAVNECGD